MAIADWIRESTARHRAKLIEQGRAEGFAIGEAEGFEQGWAESFEQGRAEGFEQAFRESYYRGYNDAVRDKARKRQRENTGHCPRSPIYAQPPTVSNCRLAATARAPTAWRNSQ